MSRASRGGSRALACALLALAAAAAHADGADQRVAPQACGTDPSGIESAVGGYYEGRVDGGPPIALQLPYPHVTVPAPAGSTLAPRNPVEALAWLRTPSYDGRPRALEAAPARGAADASAFALAARSDASHGTASPGGPQLEGTLGDDRREARGTWRDAAGGAARPFTLARVAEYRALHVVQPRKPGADPAGMPGAGRPRDVLAVWPVLADAALTARLRATTADCGRQDALEESHVATIAWNGPRALGIRIQDYLYFPGAAHGQPSSRTLNFTRTADAALAAASPGDRLRFTPACRPRLGAQVVAALKRDGATATTDLRALGPDDHNALLLPHGVTFFFDPYEAGAYAEGVHRAFVPDAALGACAR